MGKNAIVTLSFGDGYREIYEINKKCFENYAKKINADFIKITEQKISSKIIQYEKFIIYDLLNTYDRIIYVDQDVIIRDDTPNLFDIVPEEKLGVLNEAYFVNRMGVLKSFAFNLGIEFIDNGAYYNTGIMVVSKKHKNIFIKPKEEINDFYEQTYVNLIINKSLNAEDDIFYLDCNFNRMTCMDSLLGKTRLDSYIIHYAGCPNLDLMKELMKKDLMQWKEDAPWDKYKMNVFVTVSGGLGDQVCAEPSIRHLKEKIYPNANIVVETHYPSIYRHIDLKSFKHREYISNLDNPHYMAETFPNTKTALFALVGAINCHTVDYCSLALLKKFLPFDEKSVVLKPLLGDFEELKGIVGNEDVKNSVLIHAGVHWETKTLPKEWWDDIIDGLIEKGVSVCLIGKTSDEASVLRFSKRKGLIDTVDKLNLNHLIALISLSKVLLSTDSAPIHIAGAFDNWIFLVPTIKHPDHIFPFRNGTVNYKTESLYKKLVIDDYDIPPNITKDIVLDKMLYPWDRYLLDPKEVVGRVSRRFFE